MIESIEWLRILILNHRSLEYIIIFFGSLLGGEFALFILGFLAAQNVVSILPVIVLSFFATFFPNTLWFIIGKTKTISRVILSRYASATTSIITQAVNKISRENHFLALIVIKFIIGTPFMLIMYVNRTGLKFKQFLFYETPAIFLSLFVILSIGFIAGLGFTYLSDVFNNLYVSIGFILLIIVFIIIVQLWIKKRFTQNSNADGKKEFMIQ